MKKQKIIIIIQARTDSRRFPKKVLTKINGKPVLWWVINRLKQVNCDEIIVSTTRRKIDQPIIDITRKCNASFFRGKKDDVLDRYYQTAKKFQGDIIVRITADCPLIDYQVVNKVIKKFISNKFDYVATDDDSFPKGMDTECFSMTSLKKSWINAKLKSEREHVTPYIWKNPKKFKIVKIKNLGKLGRELRLVIDHKDDVKVIRKIVHKLYKKNEIFLLKDIIELSKKSPDIFELNKNFDPNEGYNFSLIKDKK